MNAEQQGFLGGAMAGAAAGSAAGPGGAMAGAVIGGFVGWQAAKSQKKSAEREQQELERARIAAVYREFGIMQQKANMATANANRPQRSSTPQNPSGDINATQALNESGFIGQNIINTGSTTPSSSGTF